jgi:hypothetical protein
MVFYVRPGTLIAIDDDQSDRSMIVSSRHEVSFVPSAQLYLCEQGTGVRQAGRKAAGACVGETAAIIAGGNALCVPDTFNGLIPCSHGF